MSKYDNLVFVDCEARGPSPVTGTMTEFGAVHYGSRRTFHGLIYEGRPDPENPAVPLVGRMIASPRTVAKDFAAWLGITEGRPVFVSDNPAYDWQWISAMFDDAGIANPFGHSGRRISDFWAGVQGDWSKTQSWKKVRVTRHDHNPVHDALGNVEAFQQILELMKKTGVDTSPPGG